ncbi:hypothetical protein TcWFU_005420 [Taenia crassiceps]|uniref:Uncharacterized protein n=1 Tax=Taenia crassiceps TaxID=6207 RepID=A0ABR4Q376_9CEST
MWRAFYPAIDAVYHLVWFDFHFPAEFCWSQCPLNHNNHSMPSSSSADYSLPLRSHSESYGPLPQGTTNRSERFIAEKVDGYSNLMSMTLEDVSREDDDINSTGFHRPNGARGSVEDEDSSYVLADNSKRVGYDYRPRKSFTLKYHGAKTLIPSSSHRYPTKSIPNQKYLLKSEKPVHRDAGYTKAHKGSEHSRSPLPRTQPKTSFQESPRLPQPMEVLLNDTQASIKRKTLERVDAPLNDIFGSIHQDLKNFESFRCHDSLCESRPRRKWFPDFEDVPWEHYSNPLSESSRSPSCPELKSDKPDRRWGKGTSCCHK